MWYKNSRKHSDQTKVLIIIIHAKIDYNFQCLPTENADCVDAKTDQIFAGTTSRLVEISVFQLCGELKGCFAQGSTSLMIFLHA